jgi:hypothetical protein
LVCIGFHPGVGLEQKVYISLGIYRVILVNTIDHYLFAHN